MSDPSEGTSLSKTIVRLSEDVVNKIAAAEIIHRPSNAIKELIENSLDAGSTSIKLTLKEGGLKLIQITDNGHGINRADLPLLCTRYATSKLRKFDDLQSLVTYGFRGEALASISFCSHVEVVSKTRDEGCGWRAHYANGELVPAKPGMSSDPRPAAANDGTVISAEDLFFNMPMRKRAFKSPSEEYNRILDVVTKYAVHNPHAAWVCKKAGTALPDISTPAASDVKSNISLLYTPSLAAELLEVKETVLQPADKLGAKCRGWVSSANANWARRGGWLLFINNRLVESSKIKKAIESLYTTVLPKGASPWVYLSLEIDPAKVDVNVHPTKSEVHFLNEDEMVEAIVAAVHGALANANVSRSFNVQPLLPGAADPSEKRGESSIAHLARKAAPNYKVRLDPTNRTLDSMIIVENPSQVAAFTDSLAVGDRPSKRRAVGPMGSAEEPLEVEDEEDEVDKDEGAEGGVLWKAGDDVGPSKKAGGIPESECEFTSIQELRRAVRKRGNPGLNEIMTRHAFVGVVDPNLALSLIQHSTKLYLIDHAALGDEHFFQLGLRQFGALNKIRLEPAPDLRELLRLAAADEPGIAQNGLDAEQVVEDIASLLEDKREMLDEYFSLSITDDGEVEALPMLLRGYTPNLDRLPHFMLCLGTQVDWDTEKECFRAFLRELAFFYSPRPFAHASSLEVPTETEGEVDPAATTQEEIDHQLWQLEHVLFPSFQKHTTWPGDFLGREVSQLASLPDLFKVFERC